ncbi:hypothetical protein MKC74_21735 [[Clostridium] innocuum]|nr:hypothetical protein [[Clostridium] innocuum]
MQNLGIFIVALAKYFILIFLLCDIILLIKKHLRETRLYWDCVVINGDIVIKDKEYLEIYKKNFSDDSGYDKDFLENYIGQQDLVIKIYDERGNGYHSCYMISELISVEYY